MQLEPTDRWRSERVQLFLLLPDAVSDEYIAWLSDGEVNQYLESRFTVQDRIAVESFVSKMLTSDRDVMFGIHDVALDRHVGNIKLGPIDRWHGIGEIGLMIGDRSAWGHGIGSAAIAQVVDIAECELGLRRLTAGCYASNIGSKRAFEKAGFAVEGVRPGHFLRNGQPEDLVLLGKSLKL